MVINYSVRHKKTRLENLVFITIPAAGVEPARPCGHWILRLDSMIFLTS